MGVRAQATVEYLGLCLLVVVALAALAAAGPLRDRTHPHGDVRYLALARRLAPTLLLERGAGSELPVDFRRCRAPACARPGGARPVLFLHAVRRGETTYLEYWEYLPDSRLARTGLPLLDGRHRDDWEGVIVKLRGDGTVAGARASAHLGWNGVRPWWDLRRGGWAPYPASVYRAAGSHAGSFSPADIDLAGDGWSGTAARVRPALVPADVAARGAPPFAAGAVAPWEKEAWGDPESAITGRPGDRAPYARYARWWAAVCLPCRWGTHALGAP
jgi:hypothetical protein